MLRKRRNARAPQAAPGPVQGGGGKKLLNVGLAIVVLSVLSATAYFAFLSDDKPAGTSSRKTGAPKAVPKARRTAQNLDDLVELSPDRLAGVDIAEMNLLRTLRIAISSSGNRSQS